MTIFDHEKLIVYQKSIAFISWIEDRIKSIPKNISAREQLERASTSIPLNIAEGNGKFSIKERCRYFGTACASAVECAACLDVLVARNIIDSKEADDGKQALKEIVSMLISLIKKLKDRVSEESVEYIVYQESEIE